RLAYFGERLGLVGRQDQSLVADVRPLEGRGDRGEDCKTLSHGLHHAIEHGLVDVFDVADALEGHVHPLVGDRVEAGDRADCSAVAVYEVEHLRLVLLGDVPGVEPRADLPTGPPPPVVGHGVVVCVERGVVDHQMSDLGASVWPSAGMSYSSMNARRSAGQMLSETSRTS